MDMGLITGLVAICGVLFNFIRLGHWQGSIESRVKNLEQASFNAFSKLDSITNALEKNNLILTELKTRLDIMFERRKRKND